MTSTGEPPVRSDDDHDSRLTPDDRDQHGGGAAGWRLRMIAAAGSVWEEVTFVCRRLIIWWFGYDFFISYCHESESYCQALYESLSKDYVCFRDRAPEGILAGERLGDSISTALRRSRILVLIWSPAVAVNEWPRAESRFFSVYSPHRRLILICPSPYSPDVTNVLFSSALPALQTDLERWLRDAGTTVPESFVPVSSPRAIVEEQLTDLRGHTPSAQTLKQLHESHGGASIPRKARRIALSVSATLIVLTIGLWMYYAAESARQIVALLQQSPFDSEKVTENDSADMSFALRATIHEAQLQTAARQHGNSSSDEWNRICDLLDDYHFYRWWSSLGWGRQGIVLEIRGIPDAVVAPTQRLPRGIVDLRLSGKQLSSEWIEVVSTATTTRILGISTAVLQSPEQLAKSLRQMQVSDLRISLCNGISRQWFQDVGSETLGRLRILRLSRLPDLAMMTAEEQKEFASVLMQCRNLKELMLDQLVNCLFSKGFFRTLIQNHKSLCETGFIQVDSVSLPDHGVSLPEESVPGCQCRIQMPDFADIL